MRFTLFTTAVSLLEFASQANAVSITPTQKPSVTDGVDVFATSELAQSEKVSKALEESDPTTLTKSQEDYFTNTVDQIIKRSNEQGHADKPKQAGCELKGTDPKQQGSDSKGSSQPIGNHSDYQGDGRQMRPS